MSETFFNPDLAVKPGGDEFRTMGGLGSVGDENFFNPDLNVKPGGDTVTTMGGLDALPVESAPTFDLGQFIGSAAQLAQLYPGIQNRPQYEPGLTDLRYTRSFTGAGEPGGSFYSPSGAGGVAGPPSDEIVYQQPLLQPQTQAQGALNEALLAGLLGMDWTGAYNDYLRNLEAQTQDINISNVVSPNISPTMTNIQQQSQEQAQYMGDSTGQRQDQDQDDFDNIDIDSYVRDILGGTGGTSVGGLDDFFNQGPVTPGDEGPSDTTDTGDLSPIEFIQNKVQADQAAKAAAEAAAEAERVRQAEEIRKTEEAHQRELAAQEAERQRLEAVKKAEAERQAQEAARIAEEARKADEARKAEEARIAEEARVAEEARQRQLAEEAERQRQEAARQAAEEAERQRLAEEARQAEETRKAEEARVAEEARQRQLAEEAERQRQLAAEEAASQAEAQRQAEEARKAEEARQAAEAEAQRQAAAQQAAEQAERQRQAELAAQLEASRASLTALAQSNSSELLNGLKSQLQNSISAFDTEIANANRSLQHGGFLLQMGQRNGDTSAISSAGELIEQSRQRIDFANQSKADAISKLNNFDSLFTNSTGSILSTLANKDIPFDSAITEIVSQAIQTVGGDVLAEVIGPYVPYVGPAITAIQGIVSGQSTGTIAANVALQLSYAIPGVGPWIAAAVALDSVLSQALGYDSPVKAAVAGVAKNLDKAINWVSDQANDIGRGVSNFFRRLGFEEGGLVDIGEDSMYNEYDDYGGLFGLPFEVVPDMYAEQPMMYARGGVIPLPGGGKIARGPGGGLDDLIPTSIDGRRAAALSDGEFVIPADVVSMMGDGSSNAGAKRLYDLVRQIRQDKTGTSKQAGPLQVGKILERTMR